MERLRIAEEALGSRPFLHEVHKCFPQVLLGGQDGVVFSIPRFETKCLQQLHARQNHVHTGVDAEREKENALQGKPAYVRAPGRQYNDFTSQPVMFAVKSGQPSGKTTKLKNKQNKREKKHWDMNFLNFY